MFLLILLLVQGSTKKQQSSAYTSPVCHDPPCKTRHIKVKIYVGDDLWKNMTENWGNNSKKLINFQIEKTFKEVNKLLADLDNGGFKLVFDMNDIVKLSDSEVQLDDKYTDRIDNNT